MDSSHLGSGSEWILSRYELSLTVSRSVITRLGFAVQLKFFGGHGRFPRSEADLDLEVIQCIAEQTASKLDPSTTIRHRAAVCGGIAPKSAALLP
jgi:hypothetical protein